MEDTAQSLLESFATTEPTAGLQTRPKRVIKRTTTIFHLYSLPGEKFTKTVAAFPRYFVMLSLSRKINKRSGTSQKYLLVSPSASHGSNACRNKFNLYIRAMNTRKLWSD